MARRKKKPVDPDKNVVVEKLFLDDFPTEEENVLIGIRSKIPLYRIAFDLNRFLGTDFRLSEEDLKVVRKDKEVAYEHYVTSENVLGQRIRLVSNEILVEIPHPDSLFHTHEARYLFPELESMNYLLILTPDAEIDYESVRQKFQASYSIQWISVDINKCHTAFPIFPV